MQIDQSSSSAVDSDQSAEEIHFEQKCLFGN